MKKLYYYGLELGSGLLALVVTNEENEALYVHYYGYDQEIEYLEEDVKAFIEDCENNENPIEVISYWDGGEEDPVEAWKELENDYEEALLNNSEIPYEIITEGYIKL